MAMREKPKKFSERIRSVRGSLDLTRERFAQLMGVSLATVNRWELEDVIPSSPTHAIVEGLELAIQRGRGQLIREQFLSGALGAAGGPKLYHFIYRSAYE
ncbi:MAG TPA: helix-turn-helix domain-containing protein [Planctomycetota bacterium]|nr:helix-turn-helix domain-containing protein [Planctomycetota bacterium]